MISFIAYFRASTERQGRSELGLAAQRRKISDYVAGAGTLIAEFCDVQSGKDGSRGTPDEWCFKRARQKLRAGHYTFGGEPPR